MTVTSWSPSRVAAYEECPRKFKLEKLDKLCPKCFKGKLDGGYDRPAVCGACKAVMEVPAPLARGSEIGKNLEEYVLGKADALHPEVLNAASRKLATSLRKLAVRGKAKPELPILLDKDWQVVPPGWAHFKRVWLNTKLDVFVLKDKKTARVIDWKTGGIDRRTGEIKADRKYDFQLLTYSVAALCAFPEVERVTSALVFVDCPAAADPVVEREECNLDRKRLPVAKASLLVRCAPLFNDDVMGPSPSMGCRWCPFSKSKGGPCEH